MRCEIVRMMMIVLYLLISIWILALGSLGLDNKSVRSAAVPVRDAPCVPNPLIRTLDKAYQPGTAANWSDPTELPPPLPRPSEAGKNGVRSPRCWAWTCGRAGRG